MFKSIKTRVVCTPTNLVQTPLWGPPWALDGLAEDLVGVGGSHGRVVGAGGLRPACFGRESAFGPCGPVLGSSGVVLVAELRCEDAGRRRSPEAARRRVS